MADAELARAAATLGMNDDGEQQDAVRQSVLSADAAQFQATLAKYALTSETPLVFLMNWFHQWQHEYEVYAQVLETELAQADDSDEEEEEDAEETEENDKKSADFIEKDLEELEEEAEKIFTGFGAIAATLLESVESVDTVLDRHGWTLLMQAANSGLRELLDKVVAMGADVNFNGKAKDGVNALYLAVSSNHTNEAMVLLKNGAIASATKVVKSRAETETEAANEEEATEATDEEEDCAFFQACRMGELSVLEEMLALGVDVNYALPTGGDCALHVAVMFEMQDVVELLVANDALMVNAKNHSGQTCLFGCSNLELARYLVEHGVDPRVKDSDDETAFSVAHALGDDQVAEFLKPLSA
ncbi:hypothetical protein Poli38472_012841 [Pythium oligandrum]|uniref:Uncharacterized protein n=1 Tax=Pythium oligandrum TaxID=41045 RepID=A0A8K1CJJ1_PYTOL|nr:hypothetical protein Poli38472_012841 [Pythium oligandrum]|eukprot:TMW64219.1 hypothetical protein Poli38472_012841 [Pythium oligandrum]